MPLNKTYPSWQVLLLQIIMGGISICRGWVPLNMIFPQWPGPLTKTILGCISIFWGWMPLNQTYNQWTGLVIKSVLGGIGIFCDWMTLNTTYPHWPGSLTKTILECICIFNKRKSLVAQTYRISCFGGPAELSSQNSKYIRQNGCFNLIQNLLNFPRQKLRGNTSTIQRAVHWILPTFRINRFGGSSGRAIQTSNYFR